MVTQGDSPSLKATRRRGARFLQAVGFLVAAGMLLIAAREVPFEDQWVLTSMEGRELRLSGDIHGSWRAEWVRFLPHKESGELPPGLLGVLDEPADELLAALESPLGVWVHPSGVAPVLSDSDDPSQWQPPSRVRWPLRASLQPGLGLVLRDLQASGLVWALVCVLLCVLSIVTRWWCLLARMGCSNSWLTCLRLTFVGMFFNVLLPGSTGGDLARGFAVIRNHSERRAAALASVVMDRVIGLLAMFLLATVAVALADDRFRFLLPWVGGAAATMVVGLVSFAHPGLRRWIGEGLGLDGWMGRLPQGRRLLALEESMRLVLVAPRTLALALLMSLLNHLLATTAIVSLAVAFGASLGFHEFLCISTVANTITAVPISPGGLGVGEVLFGSLFDVAGSLYMLGVATSLTYRLLLMVAGLLGGVALLLPGGDQLKEQYRAGQAAALSSSDTSED